VKRFRHPDTAASIVTKETATLISSRRALSAIGLMLVALAAVLPAGAQAAGPELTVAITHSPATFQREDQADQYALTVTNTGDTTTTGEITLTDELPSGLKFRRFENSGPYACPSNAEVVAGAPLACTDNEGIEPGGSLGPLILAVVVSPDAPDVVVNQATVSGGGAIILGSATDPTPVVDRPPFAIDDFFARSLDEGGDDYTSAGGHPYQATAGFTFPTYRSPLSTPPVEDVKDIFTELPAGFIGNVSGFPRCDPTRLQAFVVICPPGSVVGEVSLFTSLAGGAFPVYNVIPERGYPAAFAFKYFGNAIVSYPQLRPRTGRYGLDISAPGAARIGIRSIALTLFGVPSERNGFGGPPIPLLSNQSDCSVAEPVTKIAVDSWQHPARLLADGFPDLNDPLWHTATAPAPPVTGCDNPVLSSQFKPTFDAQPVQEHPVVQADQPAGLKVDLNFPQSNDPTDPNTTFDPSIPQAPQLKDATVKLPAGLSISPSAAGGLAGCSDLASGPAGDQVHYDTTEPVTCPDASKIGTVTGTSPLLAAHDPVTDAVTGPEPIDGDIYILKPHPGDLPPGGVQDGTYRLLIQLEDAERGINVKLSGTAVANGTTGQLTATFTENPELPVSHLELDLNSGQRAPLATPVTCGTFTTTTDLVPWSTPGTPDATPSSSFAVGAGPNGSACANTPGQRPFAPTLSAGTESSAAGAASPFVLKITRGDGEQELSQLDTTLPKGLLATLKGVPYCSDAAIASAASKSGAAEASGPSCPAASQIGTITAGAGPGTSPYYVSGKAYLAGPYKGAPLSVAFITPAVAGPFDLGNVVVRAALSVDPETAQVTVKTDPLPQILDGVPLRLRSIVARIDRPGFTLNPTNCQPMAVSASIGGGSGARATPSNSFQVGNCEALAFRPSLKLSLTGATRRTGHPALKAVVSYPQGGGYANIARAQVSLPHSEFLDQGNIGQACTRVLLAQHACSAKSIYGKVKAWTPLLDAPLEGPVYLVGGYGYKLPALVAELDGQIDVLLVGKIDTDKNKGIRNTFEAVPDAPVERFVLEMKGGKKYGLLENSEDICRKEQKAGVAFGAQNGRSTTSTVKIANSCGKGKKKAKAGHGAKKKGKKSSKK
jgi:uncharacterized repeat protein (TIGR01451 family)